MYDGRFTMYDLNYSAPEAREFGRASADGQRACVAPTGANRQCGAGESIWKVRAPAARARVANAGAEIVKCRSDAVTKRQRSRWCSRAANRVCGLSQTRAIVLIRLMG